MALQGTIDTFELTEVARLLAAGEKTGVLRLEGSRGSGRLWVNGGRVTGIEVDHAPRTAGHADAMFELLRFEDGSFTFVSGDAPAAEGEPTDLEAILGDAEAQLAEWREIERVVPTTRATITLRPELERGDVVLDKQRWRLVATIGGGITVATLGEAMDLGELPVSRAVKELIELGVVDLDATPAEEPAPAPIEEPAPAPVEEPVSAPVEVVVPEAEPVFEPTIDPESLMEKPESVFIETEPVLSPGAEDSARSTLDDFAAGFGLSDPPVDGSEPTGASSFGGDDFSFGADDDFAGFGVVGDGEGMPEADAGSSPDPLGDFLLDDPSAAPPASMEPEAEAFGEAPSPFLSAGNDAAEVARQLSNLSPAAARAVAAAAKATTDEEREAALAAVAQEGDEPIDRELLLRFLASVKS